MKLDKIFRKLNAKSKNNILYIYWLIFADVIHNAIGKFIIFEIKLALNYLANIIKGEINVKF